LTIEPAESVLLKRYSCNDHKLMKGIC